MKTIQVALLSLICPLVVQAQVVHTSCCEPDPTLSLFSACVLGGGPRRDFDILPSIERELFGGETIILRWSDAPKETCIAGFLDTDESVDLMDELCWRDIFEDQNGTCEVWNDPDLEPEIWCETWRFWFDCVGFFDLNLDEHVDLLDYATIQNEWQPQ